MKKIFLRFSFSFLLFILIFIAPTIIVLIIFSKNGFDISYWGNWVIIIGIVWFTFLSLGHILFRITFEKELVKITGDVISKDEKIQYPCSVKYKDIKSIDLIMSSYNSKNKPIKLAWISSSIPKSYIEIKTDNKIYRFCVTYYSGHQKRKIIDEIKKRCDEAGNHLELDDTKTIYENYLKKKKAVFHNFNDENNIRGNETKTKK